MTKKELLNLYLKSGSSRNLAELLDHPHSISVKWEGGSQLEAFCTSGDSPGNEGNDGR